MHHHHHTDYVEVVSAKGPTALSSKMKATFITMMVVGFGAFALNAFLTGTDASPPSMGGRIGWIALLHNFYFFTGLSAAGVVVAAIIHITHAMWGRPIKRFAEACGAFLPYSLIFMVILYFGADNLYEWIEINKNDKLHLSENKAIWLQHGFWGIRCIGYIVILAIISRLFVNASVRADQGLAHETNPDKWEQPAGWSGIESEREASQKKQGVLSAFYCVAYAVCISMLAYDLIMSLDHRWISTMFGGWHFTSYMLLAWGSLVLITHFMSRHFGLEKYMHKKLYHDLGKLTFGFTVVWGYLLFAQVNVIWYGNLSHETGWMITRAFDPNWQTLTIIAVVMVFILPFSLGLGKNRKMSPYTFAPVVVISIIGLWIERFVQIAPATWYYDRTAGSEGYMGNISLLLIWDVIIFCGFFGLFALVFANFLFKRPVMCIADPRLDLGINRH